MKFKLWTSLVFALGGAAAPATAQIVFNFSTGPVLDTMAMASRPDSPGKFEIETADDFVLTQATTINSATFTGVLVARPGPATVTGVTVEIYRVFPLDSDVTRTPQVPTRVNSPSDDAFGSRSSDDASLTFGTTLLSPSFTVVNSIQPGGIHPSPNQATGGNGPIVGQEVQFIVNFAIPFDLPADHYFFVPQVQLSSGDFYWLSASRPIVSPGTPFPPCFTDLQAWTRDAALDPDWLRVGTDIVGGAPAPTFNAAFTLTGVTADSTAVPEPATYGFVGATALAGMIFLRRRRRESISP